MIAVSFAAGFFSTTLMAKLKKSGSRDYYKGLGALHGLAGKNFNYYNQIDGS